MDELPQVRVRRPKDALPAYSLFEGCKVVYDKHYYTKNIISGPSIHILTKLGIQRDHVKNGTTVWIHFGIIYNFF